MMRLELIHPMFIHFPIALLLVGSGLKLIAFWMKKSSRYHVILFSSRLIVIIGVYFAWGSVFAGEVAEDIVRKSLCQPQVLDIHRDLGYATSYLFTAALLFDWPREWLKSTRFFKPFTILSSLLFTEGTIVILSTAFFGGSLVYDQGAAVEKQCIPNVIQKSGI